MADTPSFTIQLEQQQGYEFRVKFDAPNIPPLLLDEPEPLGQGRGPNPDRLIAAAVANCLAASLLFCMRNKFKQTPGALRAEATGTLTRNEHGRMRLGGFGVTIQLSDPAERIAHLDRCLQQFEDFCVVTESIRHGIPVQVKVVDAKGAVLHEAQS
jgi:organic hydroperoxide reductase OsmC/OhrA